MVEAVVIVVVRRKEGREEEKRDYAMSGFAGRGPRGAPKMFCYFLRIWIAVVSQDTKVPRML